MSDTTKKILRIAYYAAVTLALVVAGVCLMAACLAIYRSGPNPGDQPFTREVVAAHFAPIALPVWLSVGVAALGFILRPLLPDAPAPKADVTATVLKNRAARTDLTACPAELKTAVAKERRLRRIHKEVADGLLAVGAILFLGYALDVNHFDKSAISPAMVAAMWVLLPCMGVPFAYGVFAAYYNRGSEKRELVLLKQAPAEAVSPAPTKQPSADRRVALTRRCVLCVAVALLLYGFIVGGWMDVLTKAINICTECIGLG